MDDVTSYEEFHEGPLEHVARLARFFSAPEPVMPYAEAVPPDPYRNLRPEEIEEWRNVMSPDQQRRAWLRLPPAMIERFGWSP